MATTSSAAFPLAVPQRSTGARDLVELVFGFALILFVIWMPETLQRILSPLALVATLSIVLARRRSLLELGLSWRTLIPSWWILPAAMALGALGVFVAMRIGTLHSLYKGDFRHVAGYVLWTNYQQFLLQDYFMPRARRILSSEAAALGLTAVLFAIAHLPNLALTAATLVWGAVSCILFRRYRNIYALGLAQGLLGICFAICVPETLSHHLRVGLGYLNYRAIPPTP